MEYLNPSRLRAALKAISRPSYLLTVEERNLIGAPTDIPEVALKAAAEEALAEMIMAVFREASDKTPRLYGERRSDYQ